MNRGFSLVPILLGAAAGALVAVLQAPKPNRPSAVAKAVPAVAAAPSARVPEPARTDTPSPETAAGPAPSASAAPVASAASAAPSAGVAPGSSSGAASSAPGKPVFDLTEPTDAISLLEAQVACNRSVPEACERAARALESGGAGTKDPGRGRSLKRIALTLYVKQCEASRPAACARLAEMYEVGEVVQKSDKSVQGLRARVVELCKTRPNELGCAGS